MNRMLYVKIGMFQNEIEYNGVDKPYDSNNLVSKL